MIALTGGTGHLGNVIARLLEERNEPYRLIVRNTSFVDELGLSPASVVEGDLLDAASLEACFAGCDSVIHTAARVSVDNRDETALMMVNYEGTRNVIRSCRTAGVRRLVAVGSVETFDLEGGTMPGADGRVDPSKPILTYGYTKALATNAVIEANDDGLSTCVLSPTAIIGPWDHKPSPIGRFVNAYLKQRLPAYVHGGFDFVDVRDVADVCIRATGVDSGVHYALSGEYIEVLRLLELVHDYSGVRIPRICIPDSVARLYGRISGAVNRFVGRTPIVTYETVRLLSLVPKIDSASARRDLGFSPRPIEETIHDTVEWFTTRMG